MTTRNNTTIRLSPEERAEIEQTMKEYGFAELAPFIRFAVKILRFQRKALIK